MKVLCKLVGRQIATHEDGDVPHRRLSGHTARCLNCQAVKARDRRLRRALAGLATQTLTAPAGLATAVGIAIETRAVEQMLAPVTALLEPGRKRIGSPGALVGVAAFAAGGAALAAWRITKRPA